MNKELNVVLIGKLWGVGGAEKSLIMLSNALAEMKHNNNIDCYGEWTISLPYT
jgi:hypothetical protein